MSGETLGTDLFGDPVLKSREGPGRPEIVWNKRTSDRVLLSFARGLSVKIAADLEQMSAPTLRKVYFCECAKRQTSLMRLEMTQLVRLNDEAAKGNVGAERELARRLDQLRMRDGAKAQASAPPVKAPKLGKKEAADKAAFEQRGLYETPASPQLMN